MSENTATREEEETQKVAERTEPEVDDTEPEDEPETTNDGAEKAEQQQQQRQQNRGAHGRRSGRHEHKHQMRWTDARVMELMRCAAEMERPPNVVGWGKVETSFKTLLGIVQHAPNAAAVWGSDLGLLTRPKLHNKFDQVLRQVHSDTYRPDEDSPPSFMDALRAVVKQLTDKQRMLEASDNTPQGRWDAALRRVSEAWAAAPERSDLVLSKRRIATAKQLLLGVRRMTPVYDEHGAPLFPPLVRWNADTNMPEVVSLSDAPNTPHTARAFRDSLGQTPRGRRGGGARRSVGQRRSTAAAKDEATDTTAAAAPADSQSTEYSAQADTEKEGDDDDGEQVDSSTDEEDEEVVTERRSSSVGGRRGRRRSMVVEVPERMRLRKRDRKTDYNDDNDEDEDKVKSSSNNTGIRTLLPMQQQQHVSLAHCLGTGAMDDDVCLCRLTRTELLSYGVAITGFCPDCKHKLAYHS